MTGLALQVGLDTKAVLEAWNAIQKKHPELPVFVVTADESTSRFLPPMLYAACISVIYCLDSGRHWHGKADSGVPPQRIK